MKEIKIKNENIEYKKLLKEEELKTKLEIFLKKEELIIIDTISDSEVIAKSKSNPLKLKLKYSNSSWYVDEII